MARGRRYIRDAKGRFARSAKSAAAGVKRTAKVGRVGPGQFRGVTVSGTRTIKRRNVKVAVYGSASVGVKLAR